MEEMSQGSLKCEMKSRKKVVNEMIAIKSYGSYETIIEVETEDEAMNIIRMWEDIDRSDGTYIPNRYYIEVV